MKKIFSLIFIAFAAVSFAVSEVSFSFGVGSSDAIKTGSDFGDNIEATVRIGSGVQLIADFKAMQYSKKEKGAGFFSKEERGLDLMILGAGLGYNLNFGRLNITPGVLINFTDFELKYKDSNTMQSDGKLDETRFIPSLDLNAKLRIFGPLDVYGRVSMILDRDNTVLVSFGGSFTFGRKRISDSDDYDEYFEDDDWEEYYE